MTSYTAIYSSNLITDFLSNSHFTQFWLTETLPSVVDLTVTHTHNNFTITCNTCPIYKKSLYLLCKIPSVHNVNFYNREFANYEHKWKNKHKCKISIQNQHSMMALNRNFTFVFIFPFMLIIANSLISLYLQVHNKPHTLFQYCSWKPD